jgi:hypothetical protein
MKNLTLVLSFLVCQLTSAQIIKSGGVSFAAGSSVSPSGSVGGCIEIEPLRNFKLRAGGSIFPGKVFAGIGYDIPTQKKLQLSLSLNYVHVGSYALMFNGGTPYEHLYKHSSARFINGAIGLNYNSLNNYSDETKIIPFVQIGYAKRTSDYSIEPFNNFMIVQSEYDKIYHRLFRSAIYWNVGLYICFNNSQKKGNEL